MLKLTKKLLPQQHITKLQQRAHNWCSKSHASQLKPCPATLMKIVYLLKLVFGKGRARCFQQSFIDPLLQWPNDSFFPPLPWSPCSPLLTGPPSFPILSPRTRFSYPLPTHYLLAASCFFLLLASSCCLLLASSSCCLLLLSCFFLVLAACFFFFFFLLFLLSFSNVLIFT